MAYNTNKLTKLDALKALAERVNTNFATKEEVNIISSKVDGLVKAGGEPNKIEKIKVNGTQQNIGEDKSIDINVPTKVSELTNDNDYQTSSDVSSAVDEAINDFATKVSNDEVVNTFKELVDYAAQHSEETVTMAGDIAQLKTDVAEKVDKDGNKQLSTEDYTTADKNKLAGLENYTHPISEAGANISGLYKIATDENGHISQVTNVVMSDITQLGIPAQDTTYNLATTTSDGLMSSIDKNKLDGIEIAASSEVTDMLNEIFSTS